MANPNFRNLRLVLLLAFIMAIALVCEFITGMVTHLFVKIPEHVDEWTAIGTSAFLISHVALGFLLALGSVGSLVAAIFARKGGIIVTSILGLIGIFFAMMNGFSFVTNQIDLSSFVMATGFGLSVVMYTLQIYLIGSSLITAGSSGRDNGAS